MFLRELSRYAVVVSKVLYILSSCNIDIKFLFASIKILTKFDHPHAYWNPTQKDQTVVLIATALRKKVPWVQAKYRTWDLQYQMNNLATPCPMSPLLNHLISVTCYFTSDPVATALTFIRVIHNPQKIWGRGQGHIWPWCLTKSQFSFDGNNRVNLKIILRPRF
jgi:hypothetical protein